MNRRVVIQSLMAGLAIILAARFWAPIASPPLFDGVVLQEPYRYLEPGQNQAGSPGSGTATVKVDGPSSPGFAVATTESPPQGQLIAPPGAFVVPTGATSITASIQPIPPTGKPATGTLAGNVYRFSVVDQSGSGLAVNAATQPTLVLRAPQGISDATVELLGETGWQPVTTLPAGQPGIFVSNVSTVGDYALVAATSATILGLDPTLIAVGLTGLGALILLVALAMWRRRERRPAPAGRRKQQEQNRSRRRHGG
jgi:hypothetical protein